MKTMQHQSKSCEVCDKQLSKSSTAHPETSKSGQCLHKNKILQRYTIPEVVHQGMTCNGCSMAPIKGYLYFCLTCPNLNLCEKCGESESHEHDLVLTSSKLGISTNSFCNRNINCGKHFRFSAASN